MENVRRTPHEARVASIASFFDNELRKISVKMSKTESRTNSVNIDGITVERKGQRILHLKKRQEEVGHARTFVLQALAGTTQTSKIPSIRRFFVRKLDEIDLETERVQSHSSAIIFGGRALKGRKQELKHLETARADTIRIANHVLGLLGQPPLVDEKSPTTT